MSRSTINTLITAEATFTSELVVQGHKRLNVGLWIGSIDCTYSEVVQSTLSATVTLFRQLPGDPTDMWRVVESWAVVNGDEQDGNIESISALPEPETCSYKIGVREGDWSGDAGDLCYARLGTS